MASSCVGRVNFWNVVAKVVEVTVAGGGEDSGQAKVAGEESRRWVYSGHLQVGGAFAVEDKWNIAEEIPDKHAVLDEGRSTEEHGKNGGD